MNTFHATRSTSQPHSIDSLGFSASLGAALAALVLIVLGAGASDVGARQPQMPTAAVAPAERTAAEIDWNLREDFKVSRYVGQPGIY